MLFKELVGNRSLSGTPFYSHGSTFCLLSSLVPNAPLFCVRPLDLAYCRTKCELKILAVSFKTIRKK